MTVRQLREVLKAAAAMRRDAGDDAGADALEQFAEGIAAKDKSTVRALAKILKSASFGPEG